MTGGRKLEQRKVEIDRDAISEHYDQLRLGIILLRQLCNYLLIPVRIE
jgi:hypothetical protein